MMFNRLRYYAASAPTLLGGITNWPALLGLPFRKQAVIKLRNGCRFRVRGLMGVWIVKEVCLDRDYAASSVPVADGWTVIDVGAGLGEFAILVAHEHPTTEVYAFEPFPASFALLEENLRLNRLENVRAFRQAVGAASGTLTLAATGEAVQHTTTGSTVSGAARSTLEVAALSLDDLFRVHGLERCDYLKIDCEGCEFEILFNAAPATLARIDRICLEYHDGFTAHSHPELVDYLQRQGYQVERTPNPVHDYLGLLYAYR